MGYLIFGIIGILLGGCCLTSAVFSLLQGGPQRPGSYVAGQICGLIFASVFFLTGIVFAILGIIELQSSPRRRRKKKRRKRFDDDDEDDRPRRRRDDDDDD